MSKIQLRWDIYFINLVFRKFSNTESTKYNIFHIFFIRLKKGRDIKHLIKFLSLFYFVIFRLCLYIIFLLVFFIYLLYYLILLQYFLLI